NNLYNVFYEQDKIAELLGKLYAYSRMSYDEDTTNSTYQAMTQQAESVLTLASSTMSLIVPEILQIDEYTIETNLKEKPEIKQYEKTLDDIARQRAHILSEKEEVLLSEASESLDTPTQTFGMLNNADLTFPLIKDEQGNDV